MKKQKLSIVSIWHYIRLTYRSILFVLLLAEYIAYRLHRGEALTTSLAQRPVILSVTWAVFAIEMVFRCFSVPSRRGF